MAIVQIITSRYRKVASNNFPVGFMTTSIIDGPLKLDEFIEHVCPH
jgi:hypothetical protein